MADFMYTRGARRSAAPTYNRWNAPQSAAQTSEQMLAALMRQPQQAQQAAPQMMRMNAPQQSQQQLGGIDPAALQSMIRQQAMAQQEARAAAAFNTESADSRADVTNATSEQAAMGPASPTTMRALKTMMNLGLGGMGLGPIAALLSGAINNPGSETGPVSSLATGVIKSKVPAIGAIDLVTQMFGVDPIVKEVDKQLQAITKPAPVASPAATAAPAAAPGGNAVNNAAGQNNGVFNGTVNANYLNGGLGSDAGTLGGPQFGGYSADGFGLLGDLGSFGDIGNDGSEGNGSTRGAFGGGSGSFGEGQY